jgi:hypothetical protein
MLSTLFLCSTTSFFFLSSSANFSASALALAISSSERFVEPCIVTFCVFQVEVSLADTSRIPLASISKVTSI